VIASNSEQTKEVQDMAKQALAYHLMKEIFIEGPRDMKSGTAELSL
jgi:hypothetical protein